MVVYIQVSEKQIRIFYVVKELFRYSYKWSSYYLKKLQKIVKEDFTLGHTEHAQYAL